MLQANDKFDITASRHSVQGKHEVDTVYYAHIKVTFFFIAVVFIFLTGNEVTANF